MSEISEKGSSLLNRVEAKVRTTAFVKTNKAHKDEREAINELEDYIASLESQLADAQARLAGYEVGFDPHTTLAKGLKQVLVKFEDGYAGEPSEFMIVRVNRKGEICDGVERWFPLPGSKGGEE